MRQAPGLVMGKHRITLGWSLQHPAVPTKRPRALEGRHPTFQECSSSRSGLILTRRQLCTEELVIHLLHKYSHTCAVLGAGRSSGWARLHKSLGHKESSTGSLQWRSFAFPEPQQELPVGMSSRNTAAFFEENHRMSRMTKGESSSPWMQSALSHRINLSRVCLMLLCKHRVPSI